MAIPEYKRYKTHSHNSNVKKVEPTPTKASRMKKESISNYFEKALNGENCGEKVVEIVENLKIKVVSILLDRSNFLNYSPYFFLNWSLEGPRQPT